MDRESKALSELADSLASAGLWQKLKCVYPLSGSIGLRKYDLKLEAKYARKASARKIFSKGK